ncbi:MAG TPA: LamG domain-containing protein [Candidatus Omnitrophota bacterium]|nr:LamG domain-containing protein [Candidatus Omnitrophota bacterium]
MNYKRGKKGISTIIATLLLVLLTIVLIGILWAVISNIVKSSSTQTTSQFGSLLLSVDLQKVTLDSSGNISAVVHRGSGAGDLTEVAFIISDGTNSVVVKKPASIEELGSQTFVLTSSDLGNISFARNISVAPVSGTNGQVGTPSNSVSITTSDILQGMGAVSWWKLDGNADDAYGVNNANSVGSPAFISGKFGNAANFTGSGEYFLVGNSSSLNGANGFSYSLWARRDTNSTNQWPSIINQGNSHFYYGIRTNNFGSQFYFEYGNSPYNGSSYSGTSTGTLPVGSWHHLAVTYDGSTLILYQDGSQVSNKTGVTLNPSFNGFYIDDGYFKGQIDEVIYFKRALTATQVQSIYNMDLSQ